MFFAFRRIWKHGIVTKPKQELLMNVGYGQPMLDVTSCTACGDCVKECPTEALSIQKLNGEKYLLIESGACVSCRVCSEVCKEGAFSMTHISLPVAKKRTELLLQYPLQEIQAYTEEEVYKV